MADREQTGVDPSTILDKEKSSEGGTPVSGSESGLVESDKEITGESVPGSDRGSDLQSDSGPADNAGSGTDVGNLSGANLELESEPIVKLEADTDSMVVAAVKEEA